MFGAETTFTKAMTAIQLTAAACALPTLAAASAAAGGRDLGSEVDLCVGSVMAVHDIPGLAVAVVAGGEIAHERGYGVKHRLRGGAVDEHTLFRYGSVGKMITGAAVMRSVDRGLIDLEDPVIEYVPELHFAPRLWTADQMRVRHLITNSAGIPSYRTLPVGSLSDWAATLEDIPLLNKPGAFFNYSNSNFALADLVVERAVGMDFDDFVEAEIFRPAGMHDSTKSARTAAASGNVTFGHSDDGTIYAPDDYDVVGDGFASAHDLAIWAASMIECDGEVLSPDSCRAAQGRQIPLHHYSGLPVGRGGGHYGFGIFVTEYPSGTVRQHSGGTPGWVANVAWVREIEFAVVMLANSWPNAHAGVSGATECILEAVAGVTMPDMGEPSHPDSWTRFAGAYDAVFEDGYEFEVVVRRDGDDLLMTAPHPNEPDQTITRVLENLHHGTFRFWVDPGSWWDVSFIAKPGNPAPVRWLRNSRFVGLQRGVRPGSGVRVSP